MINEKDHLEKTHVRWVPREGEAGATDVARSRPPDRSSISLCFVSSSLGAQKESARKNNKLRNENENENDNESYKFVSRSCQPTGPSTDDSADGDYAGPSYTCAWAAHNMLSSVGRPALWRDAGPVARPQLKEALESKPNSA
jgi:hypothetical protein